MQPSFPSGTPEDAEKRAAGKMAGKRGEGFGDIAPGAKGEIGQQDGKERMEGMTEEEKKTERYKKTYREIGLKELQDYIKQAEEEAENKKKGFNTIKEDFDEYFDLILAKEILKERGGDEARLEVKDEKTEKLTEEEKARIISEASNFEELAKAIDRIGPIEGSGRINNPEEIKETIRKEILGDAIEDIRQKRIAPDSPLVQHTLRLFTRAYGLREKINDLLQKEASPEK